MAEERHAPSKQALRKRNLPFDPNQSRRSFYHELFRTVGGEVEVLYLYRVHRYSKSLQHPTAASLVAGRACCRFLMAELTLLSLTSLG